MFFAAVISLNILLASYGRIFLKKGAEKNPPLVCVFVFEFTQVLVALPLLYWWYETPATYAYSLASGTLFSVGLFLYFWAFQKGEVSLLTPLRGLRGVVALLYSVLWWQEPLTAGEVTGILVVTLGVFALQRASRFERMLQFLFHKEALLIIVSVFLSVLASRFDKLGVEANGIYTHYVLTCTTVVTVVAIAMMIKHRRKVIKHALSHLDPNLMIVGLLFSICYATILLALELERVTIVNGLLPLSVLATTVLAGKHLGESIREKIPGTILMVGGAILIAVL